MDHHGSPITFEHFSLQRTPCRVVFARDCMQTLLQNLLNGIATGSIYALIALGYTMVYGILKLINFAHGDVFMLGSFMGYYAGNYLAAQSGGPHRPLPPAP